MKISAFHITALKKASCENFASSSNHHMLFLVWLLIKKKEKTHSTLQILVQIFSLILLYAIVKIVFLLQGCLIPWWCEVFQVLSQYDIEELFPLQFFWTSILPHCFPQGKNTKVPLQTFRHFAYLLVCDYTDH